MTFSPIEYVEVASKVASIDARAPAPLASAAAALVRAFVASA